MNNKVTNRYTIKEKQFEYHLKEGILKKGSAISYERHPILHIEYLKKKLINRKVLKKEKDFYVTRRNIDIGLLVAYNLYKGELVENINLDNISLDNDIDNRTIEFEFDKNWKNYDNFIYNNLMKDSFTFNQMFSFELKSDSFRGANASDFSYIEEKVANILMEVGEINEYRHGDSKRLECDIVDETSKVQIEVLTEFKTPFSNRDRMYNPDMIFIESLNTKTVISKPLMKKLFEKEYSGDFEKQIAIFTVGYGESILEFARQIDFMFQQPDNLKNKFSKIHLILYNPIEEQLVYINDYEKSKIVDNDKIDIKILDKNYINNMDEIAEKRYCLKCKNMVNSETMMAILPGKKLRLLLSNLRIEFHY